MRSTSVICAFVVWRTVAIAQTYTISTFAGGAAAASSGMATAVSIGTPAGIAVDASGNTFFASTQLNCVFRVDATGKLTRVAGNSRGGYSGDGGPALAAQLSAPSGVAVDSAGNLYIADSGNYRVRKVLTNGNIITVAGNGIAGFTSDGAPAVVAAFGGYVGTGVNVGGIAVDGAGNIYVGDPVNNRIRKVSPDGIITTAAGNGVAGFSGDGGPAVKAEILLGGCCAVGLAVDSAGDLFIADAGNNRVREVTTDGMIKTVAGDGEFGVSPDGTAALSAKLSFPVGVGVDAAGDLFIVHYGVVQEVSTQGVIMTVAGNGVCCGYSGDGGPATKAQLNAAAVAVDGAGNIYIGDSGNQRIRKVSSGTIATIAGNGVALGSSGDGGPATSAYFTQPGSLAADSAGNVFVVDNNTVRKISPAGVITTVAGGGTDPLGDGGPATKASLTLTSCNSLCSGIAVDAAGNLYIADIGNGRVRKVTPAGMITTVAGGGTDDSGRDGPALGASLSPTSLAVDQAGNIYVADYFDQDDGLSRVRDVTTDGNITTVAGGAPPLDDVAGVPATNTSIYVSGLAVDTQGNLYIASLGVVFKVTKGILTAIAGAGGISSADGVPAVDASLSRSLSGIATDAGGNVFFSDYVQIYKISTDGIIHLIAGSGQYGDYGSDGVAAAGVALGFIPDIAVDANGNVYASDWFNKVIHVLRPSPTTALISAVVDAASQQAGAISPGKIVVIYGSGLGPRPLAQNQANNGVLGATAGGTQVMFNGIAAPVLYASATQTAAIVPYEITGGTAMVSVSYQGQVSNTVTLTVAPSAPNIFTLNETGAGLASALNAIANGIGIGLNTPVTPVQIGGYISLYATGEGQTSPGGVDGQLGGSTATHPVQMVSATVDGIPAVVQYSGGIQGEVAGLMQVNLQIPQGVRPGGYVPVTLTVGNASSASVVWIAVSN